MPDANIYYQIVEFLKSLPNIHDKAERRAFIYSAGFDKAVEELIEFDGTTAQFCLLLVKTLEKYGTLTDGQHSLERILAAAKERVGQNRQVECEELIQAVRAVPNLIQPSKQEQPKKRFKIVFIAITFIVFIFILIFRLFISLPLSRKEKPSEQPSRSSSETNGKQLERVCPLDVSIRYSSVFPDIVKVYLFNVNDIYQSFSLEIGDIIKAPNNNQTLLDLLIGQDVSLPLIAPSERRIFDIIVYQKKRFENDKNLEWVASIDPDLLEHDYIAEQIIRDGELISSSYSNIQKEIFSSLPQSESEHSSIDPFKNTDEKLEPTGMVSAMFVPYTPIKIILPDHRGGSGDVQIDQNGWLYLGRKQLEGGDIRYEADVGTFPQLDVLDVRIEGYSNGDIGPTVFIGEVCDKFTIVKRGAWYPHIFRFTEDVEGNNIAVPGKTEIHKIHKSPETLTNKGILPIIISITGQENFVIQRIDVIGYHRAQ